MRVFLQPTGLHSIAMLRVVNALTRYKPQHVEIVKDIEAANLVVLHVIGLDAYKQAENSFGRSQEYVAIQYCGCWEQSCLHAWYDLWSNALFTWSYYDLSSHIPSGKFYYAPLGVDDVFIHAPNLHIRSPRILTSGYVSGRPQEPIEEVWAAAHETLIDAVHLGPDNVHGMSKPYPRKWKSYHNIDDISLAHLYSSCQWVSAMRYQEGFELPAIEGLARGARPICFDQPSIHYWYGDLVHYVPECYGEELVDRLCGVILDDYREVTQEEIDYVKHRFDWRPIANGFWRMVMETYSK